ncbi:MAG: helix-turn-helix domain-containing protein [Ilumatobacteraceae bacterium]
MDRAPALQLLKEAGMSGYEAKAYVALLAHGTQMNGYEVAKVSGVPRSTVYETLSKLVARGAAFEVKGESGAIGYVALPAEALIGRLRREISGTIDGLAAVLPTIARPPETRVVTHVRGWAGVVERATDVVEGAQMSLLVSVWPAEAEALRHSLERAVERGVDVSILVFGVFEPPVGRVYTHRYSSPEIVFERLRRKVFTVVADHAAVLIGAVDPTDTWGMWSDDPAVALVAAEYVRHDIALQLIAERAQDTDLGTFWQTDPELERLREASSLPARTRPAADA